MNYLLSTYLDGISVVQGTPLDPSLIMLQNTYELSAFISPLDWLQKQLADIKAVLNGEKPSVTVGGIGEMDVFGEIVIRPDVTTYISECIIGGSVSLPTWQYCRWMEQFILFATGAKATFPRNNENYKLLKVQFDIEWILNHVMRMEGEIVTRIYTVKGLPVYPQLTAHFSSDQPPSYHENILDLLRLMELGKVSEVGKADIHMSREVVLLGHKGSQLAVPFDVYKILLEDWVWFVNFVHTNFDCSTLVY